MFLRRVPGGMSRQGDVDHDRLVAERVARNDSMFRDANEGIRTAAEELGFGAEVVPFVCECADPNCREIVQLPLGEYRRVRSNPRHFLKVPGHEAAAQGHARVIAEGDGYVVAEKIGLAGELAEDYDRQTTDERG